MPAGYIQRVESLALRFASLISIGANAGLRRPIATSPSPSTIREPPTDWLGLLPHLGPGFILSASIVGSGELIATTALGAKAGFVALWIILLSCFIKVALQLQFGRHAILTGQTVMESFDAISGPRWKGVGWPIWLWFSVQPLKILQVGGIIGSLALLMQGIQGEVELLTARDLPDISVAAWCWGFALLVACMVAANRYKSVEALALVLLVGFTLLTLTSVISLQWTEYAISSADVVEGLRFEFPVGALLFVLGAFGLTGIGGDEIMQYPYWMLEKGYASYCGPHAKGDPDWDRRARGWIRVMYADALLSMVAYTIVTAAFFLLGAAVLNPKGLTPEGPEVIEILSRVYTDSLGPWAKWVFLLGAFVVLFSTLFSALAVWTRIFADAFARFGWCDFRNQASRERAIRVLAFFFPAAWASIYLVYEAPTMMVVLGGVATSVLLLLVLYAAVVFRFSETAPGVKPGVVFDIALGISCLSIGLFAVAAVVSKVSENLAPERTPAAEERTVGPTTAEFTPRSRL